MYSRKSTL